MSARRTRHSARVLLALALCLPTLLVAAGPAAAHASLVDSDPADGSTLRALPEAVTLSFNEDIRDPAFVVVRAGGEELASGEAEVTGPRVTQAVPDDAPPGRWTVAYRVVSTDGHPVTGELTFEVDEAAATPGPEESPTPTASPTTTPEPSAAATPAAGTPGEETQGLWHRHGDHVPVGGGLLALAAVVLVAARRAR